MEVTHKLVLPNVNIKDSSLSNKLKLLMISPSYGVRGETFVHLLMEDVILLA